MEKLEKTLHILHLEHLYSTFLREKINIEDIPDLSGQELKDLGVSTIGERNRLKKLCRAELGASHSDRAMEGGNDSDQTQVKSVVTGESARPPIQATENSWGQSSGAVDSQDRQFSSAEMSSASGFDVKMEENASISIGNEGNKTHLGNTVQAGCIGSMETTTRGNSTGPTETHDGNQTYLPTKGSLNLGKNAKFQLGNRNNTVTKGDFIKADRIGSYKSTTE